MGAGTTADILSADRASTRGGSSFLGGDAGGGGTNVAGAAGRAGVSASSLGPAVDDLSTTSTARSMSLRSAERLKDGSMVMNSGSCASAGRGTR